MMWPSIFTLAWLMPTPIAAAGLKVIRDPIDGQVNYRDKAFDTNYLNWLVGNGFVITVGFGDEQFHPRTRTQGHDVTQAGQCAKLPPPMTLTQISDILLDESSSPVQLRAALDEFVLLCSDVTDVVPDRSFDAWACDSLLDNGVAINPEAAAHCVTDYRRSVVFMRALHAAIETAKARFPNEAVEILYAGCGPYATLIMPLLGRFKAGELNVHLLDIHQRSLDSVSLLIEHFGLQTHNINYLQGDACHYQHPGSPHVIIAETMQKSLEQEPQFAVTANLAPQLHHRGSFIPQKIEVEFCLAALDREMATLERGEVLDADTLVRSGMRHPLATVLCLTPEHAATLLRQATQDSVTDVFELNPVLVTIPPVADLDQLDALLLTRIQAFEQHQLLDYESEITLPLRCTDVAPLRAGVSYRVSFQLGSYPRFSVVRIDE